MLRGWNSALGAAVIAIASFQAPFVHIHPDDPDHHHAHGFAHTHIALHQHESEEPEWEAHDDDETAVFLDWAPAAGQRVEIVYVEAVAGAAWEPELVNLGAAPEPEAQSHSPPQPLRLLPARAPPV